VTEALAHRPNIITAFRKPVVSGYSEEMSSHDHVANLAGAITEALRLHEARSAWKRLEELDCKARPEVRIQTGKDEFEIFNASRKERKKRSLSDNESYSPVKLPARITCYKLREEWSVYYQKYVQRYNLNDFASRPWEYIERIYTPADAANSPETKGTRFNIIEDKCNRKYWMYNILEKVRHKKNHGSLPFPENKGERKKYRIALILLMHVFIDFVGVVKEFENRDEIDIPNQRRVWSYICRNIIEINPANINIRSPKYMTSMKEVGGLDFLTYTGIFYWGRPSYQRTGSGSHVTAHALARVCREIWEMDSWDAQQIPQKEKRGQESTKKGSRSNDGDPDISTTRYRISLGKDKDKSISQIEKEIAKNMVTTPDQIKVKKDEEWCSSIYYMRRKNRRKRPTESKMVK